MRTIAKEHRTAAARDALSNLVRVDAWAGTGISVEFAHFTDRQLAVAIASLDRRARQPDFADRIDHIGRIRAERSKLDGACGPISKVALADVLWPVLLAKVEQAQRRRTEHRIPVVRVLDRATALAREYPRGKMVIPLDRS